MARLINDKGTWLLQINKDQPKELYALLSNLDGYYLETEKEEVNVYIFRLRDYCQDEAWTISESDYRNILSKISEIPDSDLIIPCEKISDSRQFKSYGIEIYDKLLKTYPSQQDQKFLSELGTKMPIDAKFQWNEDNKLEK